ncbi:MAG: hypothetical protein NC236_02360 [Mycoplasma sp.]|nr:hypothetical protein [Mycoplasma sp.]
MIQLNEYWNTSTAIGELVSAMSFSFFLVFIVFYAREYLSKQIKGSLFSVVLPVFFSIAAFSSIVIGIGTGNLFGDKKSALGLMNPAFAIIRIVQYNTWKGIYYIFGMEFLGAFIGIGLLWLTLKSFNVIDGKSSKDKFVLKDYLFLDESKFKITTVKNIWANLLVALGYLFFAFAWTDGTQLGLYFNIFALSFYLILPFVFTYKWNYFALATHISFACWVFGLFSGASKAIHIQNLAIAMAIQFLIMISFSFFTYF